MHKYHKSIDNIYKKAAIYFIFAVFFVILDIFLKNYALRNLKFKNVELLGDIFKLSLAKNTGIAFSIPIPIFFLNLLINAIIIILIISYIKQILNKKTTYLLPLTFIIIGAIINFADRIRYGFVVDYFDLKWFTVFNVADVMIFIGATIIIFQNLYERKHK